MVKQISLKALCLLLAMCLLPMSALASADVLTHAELTAWRDGLKQVLPTLSQQPSEGLYDEQSESWSFVYPFGSVVSDASSPLQGTLTQVEIVNDTLSCPRGIRVGDSLSDLLNVYGLNEVSLSGNSSSAALYTVPATLSWGWMLRTGEDEICLQFASPMEAEGMEGYFWDLNIRYSVLGGTVSSIAVDGFSQGITLAECQANLSSVEEIASVPSPETLSEGPVFGAEDLSFSGLDFSHLTLDALVSALGEPQQSEEDEHGVRTCLFRDSLAECHLEEGVWRVKALVVSGASLPGPRGVVPGLSDQAVLSAFGGYALPLENTQLYEDLSAGCWGQYTREDEQTSVTYGITLDSQRYVLTISFSDGVVTEYLIYHE